MIGTAFFVLGVIACMILIVLAVLVAIFFFAQVIDGLGRFLGVLLVVSAVFVGAAYLVEGVLYFVPDWLSNWFLSVISKLPSRRVTVSWAGGAALLAFLSAKLWDTWSDYRITKKPPPHPRPGDPDYLDWANRPKYRPAGPTRPGGNYI
jgi:hypothetical protein